MQSLKESFPLLDSGLVDDLVMIFSGIVFGATTITLLQSINKRKAKRALHYLRSLVGKSSTPDDNDGAFCDATRTGGDTSTPNCTFACQCCRIQKRMQANFKTSDHLNHENCKESTPEGKTEGECEWAQFEVWSFYCPISN